MAADRVSYSYGRTLNIGHFESVRVDCSMDSDVREGETQMTAAHRCRKLVEKMVRLKIRQELDRLVDGDG